VNELPKKLSNSVIYLTLERYDQTKKPCVTVFTNPDCQSVSDSFCVNAEDSEWHEYGKLTEILDKKSASSFMLPADSRVVLYSDSKFSMQFQVTEG